jgi:D-cysteine desulfhydrase family pyridoxal phosphate-dependent enzyme
MTMSTDLERRLDRLPRVALAGAPTPLTEARNLRAALGGPGHCPRILVKRDDLTALAGGGNKARKLEFLVGDALHEGATWLVTTGGVQSNHARMTAAAGRVAGLGTSLVLTAATTEPDVQGNLLLDHLLGAEVHFVAPGDDPRLATGPGEAEKVDGVLAELRARGERPYLIPLGGSSPVGAVGYVAGTVELVDQLLAAGEHPTRLYVAAGSRGTAAGLVLGARLAQAPYRVHGVAVSGGDPAKSVRAAEVANAAAELLGLPGILAEADFETDQSQIGPGYGLATPACLEAILLFARTEGILLDPVYTGKAMAGLIADIRAGQIDPAATVVFLHTGGLPGLFAHAAELAAAAASGEIGPR